MDFKLKTKGMSFSTRFATKAAGVTIEAGDIVALSSGLVVKAGASDTEIAYAPNGAASAATRCEVTVGNDFTLVGTADANFAVTDKGLYQDLVLSGSDQRIDLGTSTTDVFKVGIGEDSGVAGSAANVEVRINKPLF